MSKEKDQRFDKFTDQYNYWIDNVLDRFEEKRLFIYLPSCGLGDKITCFPAFRHLKSLNKDKKIILITEPLAIDIWKLCRYIDIVIPEDSIRGPEAVMIKEEFDTGKICNWSFFEHHQNHVIKSCVIHICGPESIDDLDNIDLTYQFSIYEEDLAGIKQFQDELLYKAKGRKLVAIAPANTMLSRMWPANYWAKLTEQLQKNNFYVVALGGKNDLEIKKVDFDARNKYPIRIIPRILDVFEYLVQINSGMLHIGSVNQDIKMVHLNTGQYPEHIMLPFRKNNNIYHNRIVINHSCPDKYECFYGHLTEQQIRKQSNDYSNEFKIETGQDLPIEQQMLLQKFTCWYYCLREKDKYMCNKQITPERVIEQMI